MARDGYGDMAVSNAIGSNVFDINLGLGLPFLIRIAIDRGKPISLLSDQEAVSIGLKSQRQGCKEKLDECVRMMGFYKMASPVIWRS